MHFATTEHNSDPPLDYKSNQMWTLDIFTTVYNGIKIDRSQVWYRDCALGRWQIRIGFELDETFSFL